MILKRVIYLLFYICFLTLLNIIRIHAELKENYLLRCSFSSCWDFRRNHKQSRQECQTKIYEGHRGNLRQSQRGIEEKKCRSLGNICDI